MIFTCCTELRRNALRDHPTLNGIDFLEVLDNLAPPGIARQRSLLVRLFKPVPVLVPDAVTIEGGERITPVHVEWFGVANSLPPNASAADLAYFPLLDGAERILVVRTQEAGDYSPYLLRIAVPGPVPQPLPGFDPAFSRVTFSFKVECRSEFDCAPDDACPPRTGPALQIDYLARDYASFRRLMLDRITQLVPDWRESSPADEGVTLVELLAYVADQLSYRQDAIATEAYLGTARRRVSVRRHARLVDYHMHDGCNARTWVQLEADADNVALPAGTKLLTRAAPDVVRVPPAASGPLFDELMLRRPAVFETMHDVLLFQAHNRIRFYAWGDRECCLPAGATRATLSGHLPQLAPGQVLIFEEIASPITGLARDSDLRHRHAVRLAEVLTFDGAGPLRDPLTNDTICEVRWERADALPFPLTISARTDESHGSQYVEDISVARGNVALADHGNTLPPESLPQVPEGHIRVWVSDATDECRQGHFEQLPARYRPALSQGPVTQAAPLAADASATAALRTLAADAMPSVTLSETSATPPQRWLPRRDLIASGPISQNFVVETEQDGGARLRFGNGKLGMRPLPRANFVTTYRIGNGSAGNIGAETLAHIVTPTSAVTRVRNPLPAVGGVDPESLEEVRNRAPYAFRTQKRAVTAQDYSDVSRRSSGVQRAAASFRWTGSWHTAFVTVDREAGAAVSADFETQMRAFLEPYRMAGVDLDIDEPRHVSVELDMEVCVKPEYFRAHVRRALLDELSNRELTGGRRGFFHPDKFTFAQAIYLSAIYDAAQAVAGVESVRITRFHRQGNPDAKPLEDARLELARLEIGRLDNDPNFPERGVLRLKLGGGK